MKISLAGKEAAEDSELKCSGFRIPLILLHVCQVTQVTQVYKRANRLKKNIQAFDGYGVSTKSGESLISESARVFRS